MTQPAKHTPGPWTVRYAKNITAIGTTKGEMQLSLHGVYDGLKPLSVDVHEWQANANLIAAAPAMYEALKHLVNVEELRLQATTENDYVDLVIADKHLQELAKAALTQAEGGGRE